VVVTRKKRSSKINGNILIVEDSPTQAGRLQHLLEEHGYSTTIAANGKQALEEIERNTPALVISDVIMPEMDGYTLCGRIKANDRFKDIPVVLMTSLSDPHDVMKGLECGANNFIRKPYDEKYLLSRVEYILVNSRLRETTKIGLEIEVSLGGKKHRIGSDRQQILDLLISTYEDAVHINTELEHSYSTQKALYAVAEGLQRTTSAQGAIEAALESVLGLPGIHAGWVFLHDDDRGIRLSAMRGVTAELERIIVGTSSCQCQRSLLANDFNSTAKVFDCDCLKQVANNAGVSRSHATIPLRNGSRTIGVMNLAGPDGHPFGADELRVLSGIGNQIAVALERAELLSGLEKKVAQRTAALAEEINERRRAERVLQESEAAYRSLVQGAPYGIFRCTSEGRMSMVNPRLMEILGYDSEPEILAIKNVDTEVYYDPTERARLSEQHGSNGSIQGLETRWKRKDGKPIVVRLSGRRVRDEQGSLQYFEVMVEDVTEQKQLEAQFRQAQKMEAFGQLAGGVAHDFNNLLNIILGFSDLLLEPMSAEDVSRKRVEQIRDAGLRAAALTRQLLSFSRKQIVAPRVLNINDVIVGVNKMLPRLLREDIDVAFQPAADLGLAKVDGGQIEQVIVNLAVNARDAMPDGGELHIDTANVTLDETYCRLQPDVRPGEYVMLSLGDTGTGMDMETQSHIFEPFFTTKEEGKGTGLGLATVYGIVKQSGGHIKVYSELGYGTTFKVYLPRVFESASETFPPEQSQTPQHGHETILFVDDLEAGRNVVREYLEEKGFTVLTAATAAEAIAITEQNTKPIDVLVTDLIMPGGMNGVQLANRLIAQYPRLRVIYVSGYAEGALGRHGTVGHEMRFLQKPFPMKDLIRMIRQIVDSTP